MSLAIIRADTSHLDPAWGIIDRCRAALRVRGIEQWDDVYPTRQTVVDDVAGGRLYLLTAGTVCQGIIALDPGKRPSTPHFHGAPPYSQAAWLRRYELTWPVVSLA